MEIALLVDYMHKSHFAPVNRICQALHAFHVPAHDRTESVPSYHYCSCSADQKVFQCLVYDSDKEDAKLIGIEYMIHEELFETLPEEEKPFWHSHKHEITSGFLVCTAIKGMGEEVKETGGGGGAATTALSRGTVPDEVEKGIMNILYHMYGKVIHTWHPPSSRFPMGPPVLMMSTTKEFPGPSEEKIRERDEKYGIDTKAKAESRKGYLDLDYKIAEGADAYVETGVVPQFSFETKTFFQEDGTRSQSRGE
ncbi:DUF1264-domain-containing protein [Violaceomyces palustris]|uniref:DUF1264-domain-containing protein n=1 Tax=Violaceomyces palustris TaxID=1673888 RepID=A0ACD0NV50_9BASI|nr:DUF1264-domain-containing protein [Violaceomyces palustris]